MYVSIALYAVNVAAWSAQIAHRWPTEWRDCLAIACGTGMTYIIDRADDRKRQYNDVRHRLPALAALGALMALEFSRRPELLRLSCVCFPLSLCYDKLRWSVSLADRPLVRDRCIKNAFPLSKNVFVAAFHVLWSQVILGTLDPAAPATARMFAQYLLFSVNEDVKDIREDAAARVPTVPVLCGAQCTRVAVAVAHGCLALHSLDAPPVAASFALLCAYSTAAWLLSVPSTRYMWCHFTALPVCCLLWRAPTTPL